MTNFSRTVSFNDSSVIQSIQYSFDARTLRVQFATHSVWDYEKVPLHVFTKIAGSISPGATFNELVRDRFSAIKVGKEEQEIRRVVPTKRPKRATAKG